jgi:branched-subunit amino acid transport protein
VAGVNPTTMWLTIGACAIVTAIIKGIGPFALGGRDLSPRFVGVIGLLAPALLTALVVTQALADGDELHVGADTAGVAAAGVALWRGLGILPAVGVAVVVTALLRAVG